jgi:peptidoglycan/xylan/chitin deacetylase (PgdA/CDA1 family)
MLCPKLKIPLIRNKMIFILLLTAFTFNFINIIGIGRINLEYEVKAYRNIITDDKLLQEPQKVIYLTFDDGPCDLITDKFLDVLKENNVKATFFVIGKEIKNRENIIERMKAEGHAIGLHTYSHSYKRIYTSHDKFIKEMIQTNNIIYNITGERSIVIRFPGGSHNKLNCSFLSEIHKYGFKIFDWTNSCEDTVHPEYSPNLLYKKSLKKIISKRKAPGIILLMHSNKNNHNTIKALPLIIKHYREDGYIFKVIDENTPEYYSE